MKLLLNIESLVPPLTGIGNYTYNLIEQLLNEDIDHFECFIGANYSSAQQALVECIAASQTYLNKDEKVISPATLSLAPPKPSYIKAFLRQFALAHKARDLLREFQARQRSAELKQRAEQLSKYVYHEPNFILKPHAGPSVATIHDLSFIHHPQFHPKNRVEWLTEQLPKTLDRADFLITDSDQIRDELIYDFKVSADKVRTVYLGASDIYRPLTEEQTRSTLERYKIEHGRYILFVGTLEPRKGVDALVDAWCHLPESLRKEFPLVLAGAPGWHNQDLNERISRLEATHGVRQLRFVPTEELPALYSGAATFAYPSLYEGFGLPVLEAMQCGAPVICTADTSMAEFTNGSAMLVERGNVEQLTAHLQALIEDSALRSSTREAGLTRAKEFSWQKCARQTLDIYRTIAR